MLMNLGYGRLACACNNRPYIVPIYFAYDADRLYCFSTLGRKIEWMRENPLVCVEVDEVRGHDDWASVVVFGQYVEIPNTREYAKSREHVRSLLQKRSSWWQRGYTASQIRRKDKQPVPLEFVTSEVARPVLARLPVTIEFSGPLVAPRTAVLRAKAAGTCFAFAVGREA